MNTAQPIPESPEPYPPRYWWLKRILLGSALLLGLLVAARLIWGWDADRRMREEIAAIQAAGEPILPEDFSIERVPDAENYAIPYQRAMTILSSTNNSPRNGDMMWPSYLPYPAAWYSDAQIAIAQNAGAFAPLREARQHQKVDWNINWPELFASGINNLVNKLMPFNQSRVMANLVADTAEYRHLEGNDAEALELIRDILAAADALDQQPILISHLVATGIDSLAVSALQIIAPGIRLTPEQTTSGTTQPHAHFPARREQVQELITLLLDPTHGDGWRKALYAERSLVPPSILEHTEAEVILRPLYVLDARRAFRMNDHLIASGSRPSYGGSISPTHDLSLTNLASHNFTLGINRVLEINFRNKANRRMAAVALAARLYQSDHDGAWPPSLEALVPRYLPAVPIDPLSPDARPMRYLLAGGGKRPIVYCMGEDRIEGALVETKISDEPQYDWKPRLAFQWRDLSRFVPAPLTAGPTTAPADE